jgi:hypothetical protein
MPLRIAYDASLVPKGGFEVFSSTATPIKSEKKEPAGHLFHKAALIAAGVNIGKGCIGILPVASCDMHRLFPKF